MLLCLAGAAGAAEGPVAVPADAARQARDTVYRSTAALLTALYAEYDQLRVDPGLAARRVEELVGPHVDFPTIGRLLLGRHWRQATPAQRLEFTSQFRRLLLRTYAAALVEFVVRRGVRHADIEYLGATATRDGRRALVRTRIRADQGPPVPVFYSMRVSDGAWKVYDVAVDAISLVSTYRSTFSREIDQHGLDGLIARLDRHNGGSRASGAQR